MVLWSGVIVGAKHYRQGKSDASLAEMFKDELPFWKFYPFQMKSVPLSLISEQLLGVMVTDETPTPHKISGLCWAMF